MSGFNKAVFFEGSFFRSGGREVGGGGSIWSGIFDVNITSSNLFKIN